jgi:UMF1 family MFS transporter
MTESNPLSTRRERWSWYFYDFGNSAYAAVILLAVFSVFFKDRVVGGEEGTRLWGLAILIAMFFVAITSPILGVIADFSASKKKFLFLFTTISCVCTAGLFFTGQGTIFLAMTLFIVAEIGYRSAQVFYDALLPEIAAPSEMGRISGIGWAIGSAGGIVALLIILPLVLLIKGEFVVRLSFIITAVFFALSATPIFLWLPEKAKAQTLPPGENYVSVAFKQLSKTIRTASSFREFLKFMIAFLIYNDGIIMVLDFAAIIGGVLFGFKQQDLIIFFIIVQAANVAGAYAFGFMTDRFGGMRSLVVSILLMVACIAALYFAQTSVVFYIIGVVAGVAMAGVQSVSRTMVGLFAPPGQSGEFYGFFSFMGRTSSFIGPGIYGWLAAEAAIWYKAQGLDQLPAEQAGQRIAILSIAAFLLVGMALLRFVNEKKARLAAMESVQ